MSSVAYITHTLPDQLKIFCFQEERQPTSSWKKADILAWLQAQEVDCDQSMNKLQLLALARMHRKPCSLQLDRLFDGTPHKLLFLPPYHSMWNAIELAWGIAKRYYDAHVNESPVRDATNARKVWAAALATITPDVWASMCRHTCEKILKAYDMEMTPGTEAMRVQIDEDSDLDDPDPVSIL